MSAPGFVGEDTRRWWVLTGASTGLFILMLDSTTLPLALTSIRLELGASTSGLQWVQNVYLLTMAALVITFGRLGDMLGRKRIFQLGLLGFAAGSVISATAGSVAQLIGGRVVQGAGGAALLALSLAIANLAFSPEERPRAVGIWAAVSAIALAIGPLVGGIAVELVSWRLIFWLVVPFAALALAIMAIAAPESRDETAGGRIDVPGLVTVTLGLTAVVLAGAVFGRRGQAVGLGLCGHARHPRGGPRAAGRVLGRRTSRQRADGELLALPKRSLPRRHRGGVRAGRLVLGADVLPASVHPAGP